MNGCYEHLGSGNFSEAMTSLTGEGSEALSLSPALNETDEFWHKLEYYVEEAFLMGCSIEGVGEHDNGRGLLTGHAYGIISCRVTRRDRVRLLQIFNPWGMKEWTGAWSDGSPEWTPELIEELNQSDEDDGMFWITFEDFLANFNMFSVCRLLTGAHFFPILIMIFVFLNIYCSKMMLEKFGKRMFFLGNGTKLAMVDVAIFPLGQEILSTG